VKREQVLILASTPLHLLGAVVFASLYSEAFESTLVLLDQRDTTYYDALQQSLHASPFKALHMLHLKPQGLFRKIAARRANYSLLQKIVSANQPTMILTGNDRNIAFEYAMRIAAANGLSPEGAYLDDGLHSYLPQRLKWYQYTLLDRVLQRLVYGRKTPIPRQIGDHPWIEACYLFRPQSALGHLQKRPCFALESAILRSEATTRYLKRLTASLESDITLHKAPGRLLILPHPSVKKAIPHYRKIVEKLFDTPKPIYFKLHPRDDGRFEEALCSRHPKATLLPSRIAIELLLFGLSVEEVYGMQSTALLTLAWLDPKLRIYNIQKAATQIPIFEAEGITQLTPEALL